MDIDEKTRFRADYVRVKIACRDISRVPKTTDGALGLYIYDFTFEREVQGDGTIKTLSSGIKITEKDHQPQRFKVDEPPKTLQITSSSSQGGNQNFGVGSDKNVQQHKAAVTTNSTPPKVSGGRIASNEKAKQVVTQQNIQPPNSEEQVDRVQIPDTFEESDAESETLSDKL